MNESTSVPRRSLPEFLAHAALFTISWDRIANIPFGSFNIKLPVILAICSLAAIPLTRYKSSIYDIHHRALRRVLGLSCLTAVWLLVRALLVQDFVPAVLQVTTIALGALVPFAAIGFSIRSIQGLNQALSSLIAGGYFASVFGLYQLIAFYIGWPQIVAYTAEGGGLGRISSFSYESAYFGYYLVLVIGAVYSRCSLFGLQVRIHQVGFFVFVILLGNSRSSFITLPLLFVLVTSHAKHPRIKRHLGRMLIAGCAFVLLLAIALPAYIRVLQARAESILDKTEETSNAPRLEVAGIVTEIAKDNWLTGIGPGQLVTIGPRYGLVLEEDASPNRTIANNAYLQSLIDGGIPALALEVGIVASVIRRIYGDKFPGSCHAMDGCIAVLVPASVLTSYYWDIKIWAMLALVLSCSAFESAFASREVSGSAVDSIARPNHQVSKSRIATTFNTTGPLP